MTDTIEVENSVLAGKPTYADLSLLRSDILNYITSLETEVSRLDAAHKAGLAIIDDTTIRYNRACNNHADDIAAIGQALLEEAEERDWCSIYDDFVNKLNDKLHINLETRVKEYNVEMRVMVTLTGRVEAANEEDANDVARDLFSGYSYGGSAFDVQDYDITDIDSEIN